MARMALCHRRIGWAVPWQVAERMDATVCGLGTCGFHRLVYGGDNIRIPAVWTTMEFLALANGGECGRINSRSTYFCVSVDLDQTSISQSTNQHFQLQLRPFWSAPGQ